MPATYEPIANFNLSTPASILSFTSLPSTYTDLRVVMNLADDPSEAGTGAPIIYFNNDRTSLYSQTAMWGDGSTASSASRISDTKIYALYQGNSPTSTTLFPVMIVDIMNYASSVNKVALISTAADRSGSGSAERHIGLYRSNTAISSFYVSNDGAKNFATGSTMAIYGIKRA
jgi:hypothetical protein